MYDPEKDLSARQKFFCETPHEMARNRHFQIFLACIFLLISFLSFSSLAMPAGAGANDSDDDMMIKKKKVVVF
jgi:hypothetical protein